MKKQVERNPRDEISAEPNSDISIVGLNDKGTSIQWYLTECENALNKITG